MIFFHLHWRQHTFGDFLRLKGFPSWLLSWRKKKHQSLLNFKLISECAMKKQIVAHHWHLYVWMSHVPRTRFMWHLNRCSCFTYLQLVNECSANATMHKNTFDHASLSLVTVGCPHSKAANNSLHAKSCSGPRLKLKSLYRWCCWTRSGMFYNDSKRQVYHVHTFPYR